MGTSESHIGPMSAGRSANQPLLVTGAVCLGVIWAAVIVMSIFAPDSVSGVQQDHVPIVAIISWVWGLIASRSVVTTLVAQRDRPEQIGASRILMAIVSMVWVGAAAVAVFGPELISGTDPTRVPIAALIAPIAAMVLTTTADQLFGAFTDRK